MARRSPPDPGPSATLTLGMPDRPLDPAGELPVVAIRAAGNHPFIYRKMVIGPVGGVRPVDGDLVRVVEERTALRKAGSQLTGRCPFHEERTPSFSVDPVKGYYYCFGCGKGGDAFTFVQESQGLDFAGAVEWLADRFGVELQFGNFRS